MLPRFFLTLCLLLACHNSAWAQGKTKKWKAPPPFDPARAKKVIDDLCDIGSRMSGSQGMLRQQELLEAKFRELGGEVEFQPFKGRNPQTGETVEMKNLIVRYQPQLETRILLCAHYDTRPFPDRDPQNPRGLFVGANDGASGVAFLLEMANWLNTNTLRVGVDLVAFDGEELVYDPGRKDPYFLGSTFFAQEYVTSAPTRKYQYKAGVLVDMIGDAELQLFYEKNSYQMNPQLVREIWQTAEKLKIDAFISRNRTDVEDDHLPLNRIGRIPTIDIIDFDYPTTNSRGPKFWHTTQDVPAKCSGDSVCKVAYVISEWLKKQ